LTLLILPVVRPAYALNLKTGENEAIDVVSHPSSPEPVVEVPIASEQVDELPQSCPQRMQWHPVHA